MKLYLLTILLFITFPGFGQHAVSGLVKDKESQLPIEGAVIRVYPSRHVSLTDAQGRFTIESSQQQDSLSVQILGYHTRIVVIAPLIKNYTILLETNTALLEQVVISTGYQSIAKERVTGAYSHVNETLISRSVSSDILSRIEDMSSSLQFDRRFSTSQTESGSTLRVRGLSTINSSTTPLIVLDNFPYEGTLESLNPNDVESITLLKDASAASVWGAKAANGVIVITTKKGKRNAPRTIPFSSNFTFTERPDLHYNPAFLNSKEYIEMEKQLFELGFYNDKESQRNQPVLSPVVEFLFNQRYHPQNTVNDGTLENLSKQDIRNDASKYLYRNGSHQQHHLNISGGEEKYSYQLSGGYDNTRYNTVNSGYERFTLKSNSSYDFSKWLTLNSSLLYTNATTHNSNLPVYYNQYPYNRLVDEKGQAAEVYSNLNHTYIMQEMNKTGVDWRYFPLNEINLTNKGVRKADLRIGTNLHFNINPNFKWDINHIFYELNTAETQLNDKESFYIRNLVNRYMQQDGTLRFPYNGVLYKTNARLRTHEVRTQANYNKQISEKGFLQAMAGVEVRDISQQSNASQYYDYDPLVLTHNNLGDYTSRFQVRPAGTARVPLPVSSLAKWQDRYLSYYTNWSYTLQNKYTFTGNLRWDASNLFGVKSNQKGVPLWSVGAAYTLSDSKSPLITRLPHLKIRTSYGYNGNVNTQASALVTAYYENDYTTGLKYGEIRSPGNPQLRWEKTGIWNFGLDFSTEKNRISGSIDFYHKTSKDLLGDQILDPTNGFISSGFASNIVNYATMKSSGIDAEIQTLNLDHKIKWTTSFIFSTASNKVTNYKFEELTASGLLYLIAKNNTGLIVTQGVSLDAIYYIPWIGLDSKTGSPLVNNETQNTSYQEFISKLNLSHLLYDKVAVPRYFGSVRNDWSYKNLALSINISWKAGYSFVRSSANYDAFFNNNVPHKDFENRWKQPGDERFTNVPSFPDINNTDWQLRDLIYNASAAVVEPGSHIRLRDVRLSYKFPLKKVRSTMEVFSFLNNVGLIWRANKQGLDPDYPLATLPPARSLSFGIRSNIN